MINFKKYFNDTLDEDMFGIYEEFLSNDMIDILNKKSYEVIKQKGKFITVKTENDRIKELKNIATLIGGHYNPNGTGSSVGRVESPDGIKILVKNDSKGSGAGSSITKLVESAQCLYCAARWYANGDYSALGLQRAAKYVKVDEQISKIILKLPDDWREAIILSAEALYKKYSGKKYFFHRGSDWVNRLEKHFKKLNRVEKAFSNLNKWSPADIYFISSSASKINIEETKSIEELNNLLIKSFNDGEIIGVSLKKTDKKVRIDEKNVVKKQKTLKFKNYTSGKRGFFNSNDIYVYFDGGVIQFRTFGSTWQGEIKGKSANHGKISGGPIASIMRRIALVNFEPQKKLGKKTPGNLDKFYDFYIGLGEKKMTKENFNLEVELKDNIFFISKIMSAQFLYHFLNLSAAKKNKVITAMISYAKSESELSAPFIKVY